MNEDIRIGDYTINFKDGELTVKRGQLEVNLSKINESVLINSKGLHSVRVTSINSTFGGGISKTATFPPEVFKDKVEWKITRYSPDHDMMQAFNEAYLGKSGYFYQKGNIGPEIEEHDSSSE